MRKGRIEGVMAVRQMPKAVGGDVEREQDERKPRDAWRTRPLVDAVKRGRESDSLRCSVKRRGSGSGRKLVGAAATATGERKW